MRLIAIDPGVKGACLIRDSDGVICRYKCYKPEDMAEALSDIKDATYAVMEKVGGYIGVPQPGGAMFRFGHNAGMWQGACLALKVRLELVRPQDWQKGLPDLAGKKGAERKKALKVIASRLFPDQKITLQNADAFLLMDWLMKSPLGGGSCPG